MIAFGNGAADLLAVNSLRNNGLVSILRHELVTEAKICKSWTSVKGH